MTDKVQLDCRKEDIISLIRIKQTLSLLGVALGLSLILFPVFMSRLYTKLDTINENTIKLATIQAQVANLQRDIDRIMLWIDRDRNRGASLPNSSDAAKAVCSEDCTPIVRLYALGGRIE